MKILILATYYYPYDETCRNINKMYLASSATELAEKLVGIGCRVSVLSRHIKGSGLVSIRNRVRVHRVFFIDKPVLRLLSWVITSFFKLLRLDYDITVCWDWSTALPAILASKFTGKPVVCSIRNSSQALVYKNSWKFPFYYLLEKFVFNNSKLIIYSSDWVKNTVESVIKVKSRSVVLHHGIDISKFNPSVSSDIRRKFNLNNLIVGFFGRFIEEKGVKELAEACNSVDGVNFLMVGDGPLRPFLEKVMGGKAVFTGFINRRFIPGHMQACDIIILPSHAEGFSSVVVEAMAMRKVFVGTPVGGAPELIKDGVNGLLIDGSADSIVKAINKLKDEKYRNMLSSNAVSLIKEYYDWGIIINKWGSLLRTVVA